MVNDILKPTGIVIVDEYAMFKRYVNILAVSN